MDTTASSTLIAEVPPEDGTIATALADLDHKLAAWERAVADVHATLGESANRAAVAPEQVASEKAAAASSLPVEVEERAVSSVPLIPSVADVDFDAPLTAPVSGALAEEAANLAEAAAAEADATATRVAAQAAAAAEEDERLLASLDPKKAKAIRIRRRLSNNSRSVRELLAE